MMKDKNKREEMKTKYANRTEQQEGHRERERSRESKREN